MRVPEYATDAEKLAVQKQMQQIRSQIQAGESFADLARANSQSFAAKDGGDIGEFEKASLSPQIQAALDGLEPGQVTETLDTDQGFQLFYLEAINRTEGKPLAS
jgi:parvulin-like peptidyl-prolyl isomerase